MPHPATERWYCVWVANNASAERGSGWCWSPAYHTFLDAKDRAKEKMDGGHATMSFVVHIAGKVKKVARIYPGTVKRIIDHWNDLMEAIDNL